MSLVLNVEILGEFKKLTAATTGAQTQLQKMNSAASKVSSGMNKVLGAIGIGFSLAAITRGLGDAIAAAEKVQQSDQRLQQVAKSMALFGDETTAVTSKMKKYADRLELTTGVEAETTKLVQAKLLTFKELGRTADQLDGQFDRATKAALDLAATGFGTAETNAVQLGKALQDPIKGIGALARAGVTFTDQEKEKIKVLVQSNKTLEAQDLILTAIEKQVGGVAEATAKTSDRMRNAFGQIEDALGLALLPLLDEFSAWLSTPEGQEKLDGLISLVTDLTSKFVTMLGFVIDNKEAFLVMAAAVGTLTIGMKLYAAAANLGASATTALGTAAKVALPAITATIAALETIKWLNENLSFSAGNIAASGGSSGALNFSGSSGASPSAGGSNMTFTTPAKTTAKAPVTIVNNIKTTQSAAQISATLNKQLKASGSSTIIRGGR